MSDKPKAKPASKKRKDAEKGVLAALPSTRPNRLGRPRGESASTGPKAAAAPAAKARPKPKPKPKPNAKARPKAKVKAKAVARARPKAAPTPTPITSRATSPGPRGVRPGVAALGAPPQSAPPPDPASQTGTELVSTVVQAAGELVSIGFTVGGQILKRAADRIPKP